MESISIVPVKSKPKRIQELDALRGLAALSVVLFHFTYGYDNGQRLLSTDKFYFRFGNLGVQLFFMISGFVIFMTLDHTREYKQFVLSRFSRLYPVYWFCIVLTIIVSYLSAVPFLQEIYSTTQVIMNLTMIQHFFKIKDVDGAYWTLAIELVFYFWASLLFYSVPKRLILYICFGWLLLSIFSSLSLLPYSNYLNQIFILPHTGFFVAGICYYFIKTDGYSLLIWLLLINSFIANGLALRLTPFIFTPLLVYTIFYLIFYLLIINKLSFLNKRWLLFVGVISYPLYLSHEVVGSAIIYWLRQLYDHEWFYVSAPLIIMIGIAYLIHQYIEKPSTVYIRKRFATI